MDTTLPAEVTYGYVAGQFILAVGDGTDPGDKPDGVPATGTITITPKNQVTKLANPNPATMVGQPIKCDLDDSGFLVWVVPASDPVVQQKPVPLIAGVYTVSYGLKSGAVTVPLGSHDIEVTTANTVDAPLWLTTAEPAGTPVTPTQYAELSARIDAIDPAGGAVDSVNGATGVVVLDATDVGALPDTTTIPAAQVASDWTASSGVAAILNKPTLGTAAAQNVGAFATAAQGAKADTAVQPGSLATVATTGSYDDLTNKPSGSYQWSPQVGSYWGITRSNNASTKFTVATEYAIGINLPDLTIDKVIISVATAGAAGSTMLIGLRPLTGNPSNYGAPLFTAALSTATGSNQPVATLAAPVAIPAGSYALTWCQSIDSAATATVQYAPAELNLKGFPLAQSTQVLANGHGPVVARLNTGVTSATTLPTSVAIANDNSNQASNNVPQVIIHRSA